MFYIIVDPDRPQENPNPNYIENQHVEAIAKWVKNGWMLILMANDSANVELAHFNVLASRFGISFTMMLTSLWIKEETGISLRSSMSITQ